MRKLTSIERQGLTIFWQSSGQCGYSYALILTPKIISPYSTVVKEGRAVISGRPGSVVTASALLMEINERLALQKQYENILNLTPEQHPEWVFYNKAMRLVEELLRYAKNHPQPSANIGFANILAGWQQRYEELREEE